MGEPRDTHSYCLNSHVTDFFFFSKIGQITPISPLFFFWICR